MAFATLDSSINGANFTYSNGDLTVEKTSGATALSTQINKSFAYDYKRYYFEVVADVLDAVNPFSGKMHFGIVPVLRADDTDSLESARPIGSQFFINSTSTPGFERVGWNSESHSDVALPTADYGDHPMIGAGWDDGDVLGCMIDEVPFNGGINGEGIIQVTWYLNGVHIGTMDSGNYNWRGVSWTVALSLVDQNDKITLRTDPADWTQTVPGYEVFPLADGVQFVRQTNVDTGYCRMNSGPFPISSRSIRAEASDSYDGSVRQWLFNDSRDRLEMFNPQDGLEGTTQRGCEAYGTKGHFRGKHYFEVTLTGTNWFPTPGDIHIGWVMQPSVTNADNIQPSRWAVTVRTRQLVHAFSAATIAGPAAMGNGDVLGFAVNFDALNVDTGVWTIPLYINVNGTWFADPDVAPTGSWLGGLRLGGASSEGVNHYHLYPFLKNNIAITPNGAEVATFNFGASAFSLSTLPTGYTAWDSTALP